MAREIDKRDPSVNQTTPARTRSLKERAAIVSESLPGLHKLNIESFEAATGNPSHVTSEGADAESGNYVERALSHVQSIGTVLGLEETQAPEFMADPNVQISSSGAATVHLHQQYKGIRLFQTAQGVRFNPDGSIADTVGQSVTIAQELEATPKLGVQDAVLRAAEHLAEPGAYEDAEADEFGQSVAPPPLDLEGFAPKVVATFPNQPEVPTVLEPGPFGDEIKASLVWFPLRDAPRLAWEVVFIMPGHGGQYRVLVAADDGEILYCRQLMTSVEAEGHVYLVDGASGRQAVSFPRPLAEFDVPIPEGLPEGFPDPWVASDSARGNAVNALLATTGATVRGSLQNGRLVFNPADPEGTEQQVLNIFFYNCLIHNFFYLYGFREADGNFQQDNFGRGGALADPVTAYAHPDPVPGTANMSTRVDGTSPVMNMGLVAATGRHTAFDSTVVFHEFTHGVTNRLVGGPMNTQALEDYQSAGMGEGWGDYIACTINNTTVVGAWVTDKPGGIRKFPYDGDYPDNFGMLGTGRYNRPELYKQHAVGEIWCATLLEMNRKIGSHLGVQLVVDALKLSPVRPSFLDMRDAILKALDNKLAAGQLSAPEHASALSGIWAAFARFGMGPGARSNGASLTGIVADFNTPSESPAEAAPSGAPAGEGGAAHSEAGAGFDGFDSAGADEETRRVFADVLAAIQIHGEELAAIPGVVSVGPGYRFRGANVTPRPVVTVTVLRKLDPADVPARDLIPARLGKVVVDVIPATPQQQLAFLRRRDERVAAGRPAPPGEIDTRLPGEPGREALAEVGHGAETDEAPAAEASAAEAPPPKYTPPSEPLAEVTAEMTILCHASPDAGWRNLSNFIAGTKERLTSTMYEFNARHVLDALKGLKAPRTLRLILDGGSPSGVPGPSSSTVSKLAARAELEAALNKPGQGKRFGCVWAAVRDDGMTTAGFFPTAYHTKVTVRDGEAFWLSSGNWKESGQPRLDPIEGPLPDGFSKYEFQSKHNREWHVIVHNKKLAETFEAYIKHDIAKAEPLQKPAPAPPPAPLMPDLFVPAEGGSAFEAEASEPVFFREEEFKGKVRVRPLMTPDNFAREVLPLIRNAKRSLYFQNQALSPKPSNQPHMALFLALRDKSIESAKPENKLDVKIIVSEYADLGTLKNWKYEMSRVRRQYQCHNKGIIIDDRIVVVGSHNWTGQGTTENRDASLILEDEDGKIAAYFKKLFMYDWNRIGVTDGLMFSMPLVAAPGEAPPPGMVRVPWSEFFPEWREAEA